MGGIRGKYCLNCGTHVIYCKCDTARTATDHPAPASAGRDEIGLFEKIVMLGCCFKQGIVSGEKFIERVGELVPAPATGGEPCPSCRDIGWPDGNGGLMECPTCRKEPAARVAGGEPATDSAGRPSVITLQCGSTLRFEARTTGEPGWLLHDPKGKLVFGISRIDTDMIEATIAATLAAREPAPVARVLDVEAERVAFEAWSKRVAPAYGFSRDERGQYVAYPVHAGWAAWQARAARTAAPAAPPEQPKPHLQDLDECSAALRAAPAGQHSINLDGSGHLQSEKRTTGERGWLLYDLAGKLVRALTHAECELVDRSWQDGWTEGMQEATKLLGGEILDAARYRWVRDSANSEGPNYVSMYADDDLDERVDEAMKGWK